MEKEKDLACEKNVESLHACTCPFPMRNIVQVCADAHSCTNVKYLNMHPGNDDFYSWDRSWAFGGFLDGITVCVPLLCSDDVRLKGFLLITRNSSGRVNKECLAQFATSRVKWVFHVCTRNFDQLRHGETKASRDHWQPSNCSVYDIMPDACARTQQWHFCTFLFNCHLLFRNDTWNVTLTCALCLDRTLGSHLKEVQVI